MSLMLRKLLGEKNARLGGFRGFHCMADDGGDAGGGGEGGGGDAGAGDAGGDAGAAGGEGGGGDAGAGGQSAADAVAAMNKGGEGGEGGGDRPENVPEKFWNAEKGEIRTDDVLKSYTELHSKFGAFTGAPEEYTAELTEELKEQGVELIDDDPVLGKAKEFAKEMNMNQDGFNKMIQMYAMSQLAESKAGEDHRAEQFAALGDNADRRVENVNQWAARNLDPEMVAGLEEATQSAAAFAAIETIIARGQSAPAAASDANPAPSVTEDEVKTMQFAKDENGNRKLQTDPAFKAEYERKRDLLYGTGEHRQVIGG